MPKLTLDDINQAVVKADYHVFPGTSLTVCALTTKCGFIVVGKSAYIDMADFDEAVGRTLAREDALNQVWQLEGYLAKYKIDRGILPPDEEPEFVEPVSQVQIPHVDIEALPGVDTPTQTHEPITGTAEATQSAAQTSEPDAPAADTPAADTPKVE